MQTLFKLDCGNTLGFGGNVPETIASEEPSASPLSQKPIIADDEIDEIDTQPFDSMDYDTAADSKDSGFQLANLSKASGSTHLTHRDLLNRRWKNLPKSFKTELATKLLKVRERHCRDETLKLYHFKMKESQNKQINSSVAIQKKQISPEEFVVIALDWKEQFH